MSLSRFQEEAIGGSIATLSLKDRLIEGLRAVPETISLTPVREKRPYRKGWQLEEPIERQELIRLIRNGDRQWSEKKQKHWTAHPDGYGIRFGGEYIGVDVDGFNAIAILNDLSQGDVPETVEWTSGKSGRKGMMYRISDTLQARLKENEFTHLPIYDTNNVVRDGEQQLDLRHARCQSVIPPSTHPQTGLYKWIRSFQDCKIADAPQWLEDYLFAYCDRKQEEERERQRKVEELLRQQEIRRQQPNYDPSEEITALVLLDAIDPNSLDWYEWRDSLLAAHECGVSEHDMRLWSAQSHKHTDSGFDDVWRHIKGGKTKALGYGTLWRFADLQGWQPPKRKSFDLGNDPLYKKKIAEQDEQARCDEAEDRERNLIFFKGFCRKVRTDKRRKVRDRAPEIATEQSKKQRYVPRTLPDYQPGLQLPTFTLRTMSDRNLFVYEAFEKGWKHVLDRSGTGSGKSHYAGLLDPAKFGAEEENFNLWYLTNESRSPSTATIEHNFEELPVRNQGFEATEKRTPSGNVVRKPISDGTHAGNCHLTDLFLKAGEKGYGSEGSAATNPICQKCAYVSQCAREEGSGFGFRFQRKNSMVAGTIRLNPQSAPANLPGYLIAIWEEISALIKPIVRTAKDSDLAIEWMNVEEKAPEIYELLRSIRLFLFEQIYNPSDRWGFTAKSFLEKLDFQLSSTQKAEILDVLRPILCKSLEDLVKVESRDNSELRATLNSARSRVESLQRKFFECERKIAELKRQLPCDIPQVDDLLFRLARRTKGLQPKIREYWNLIEKQSKLQHEIPEAVAECNQLETEYQNAKADTERYKQSDRQEALARIGSAPTQTLWQILNILFSPEQGLGNFRIFDSKVVLTLPNNRIKELVEGASLNFYLDATIEPSILKAQLGIEDLLICELEQEKTNNLKHYQVLGFGRCAKDRADSTNDRLDLLHTAIQEREGADSLELADYKGVTGFEAKIRHLSNSRGSNEIAGSPLLIVHGLPKPNQGAIEDEFACIANPDFSVEQYYQYRIDAEIKQLAGRQRSDRYPTEQFSIYWISEDSLPFEVEQIEAIDICYQAAPKQQRIAQSVFEAVCEAARLGLKLTQKLIAQFADCTQGFVSKWFRDRGGWTYWRDLLFEKTAEDIEQYRSQLEPQEATIAEILPSELEHATEAEEVLEIVSALFEGFGTDGFRRIWKAIGWNTRRRFFAALLTFGLPPEVWHEPVNT